MKTLFCCLFLSALLTNCGVVRRATPAEEAALYQKMYSHYVVTNGQDTLRGMLRVCGTIGQFANCVALSNAVGKSTFTPLQVQSFQWNANLPGMKTMNVVSNLMQQRKEAVSQNDSVMTYDAFVNNQELDRSFFAERLSKPDYLTLYYFPDNGDTKGPNYTIGINGAVGTRGLRWGFSDASLTRKRASGLSKRDGISWNFGEFNVSTSRSRLGVPMVGIAEILGQGYFVRRRNGDFCLFREYEPLDFKEKLLFLLEEEQLPHSPFDADIAKHNWHALPQIVAYFNAQQTQQNH